MMTACTIIHLDEVFSLIKEKEAVKFIQDKFFIMKSKWKKVGKRRIETKYKFPLVTNSGIFYSNYRNEIIDIFRKEGKSVLCGKKLLPKNFNTPIILNSKLRLREYQCEALNKLRDNKYRGIVVAIPGAGKTVIAIGLTKMLPVRTVVLTHTKDLLYQTYDRFKEVFGEDVGIIGDGKLDKRAINICLYKTLNNIFKLDIKSRGKSYGGFIRNDGTELLIVDECHHLSSFDSQYAYVINHINARYRVGLTATPPKKETDPEGYYVNKGLIGNVVCEINQDDIMDNTIIPRVQLINTKSSDLTKDYTKYQDIYEQGIVKNRFRNQQILDKAEEFLKKDKTCLILVEKIHHGEVLERMAFLRGIINSPCFLNGNTDGKIREEVKNKLINKDVKLVIATTIFKEGVDIPTLDTIINAGGGKGETPTIQKMGRITRKADGKEEGIIVDFLDQGKYLAEHSTNRLRHYNERNWLRYV